MSNVDPKEESSEALNAPLPARWGRGQRLKNHLLYGLIRVVAATLGAIPLPLLLPFARPLAALAYLVDVNNRRRAITQLAAAFPEWSPARCRQTTRRMYHHLALSAFETAAMQRLLRGPDPITLDPQWRAVFDEALAEGNGVVAVSGHIGNWELLAQSIAAAGYDVAGVAKPLYDPRLTRMVHRMRSAFGMRLLWRGDRGGSREMLRVFRRGAILALLIDQDTKVQGDFVPFFGRPAFTPTAAASLALRFNAPVVLGFVQRHGGEHRFHFERVPLPSDLAKEEAVLALTADITRRLEGAIRQAPEQWVWLHKRWHRQPE